MQNLSLRSRDIPKIAAMTTEKNSLNLSDIMMLLPTFDGAENSDVNFFISTFDDLIAKVNIDQDIKLTILKTRLKGEALKYICDNHEMLSEKTFENFCKKLTDKFSKTNSFPEAQTKFMTVAQNPSQTVEQYVQEVNNVTQKYLQASKLQEDGGAISFINKMKINKFIDGLIPTIQLEVRKAAPETYQEAVKIAKRIETALKMPNNPMHTQSDDFLINTIMQFKKENENQINKLAEQINRISINNISTQEKYCHICKKNNHLTDACWFKFNGNQNNWGIANDQTLQRGDYTQNYFPAPEYRNPRPRFSPRGVNNQQFRQSPNMRNQYHNHNYNRRRNENQNRQNSNRDDGRTNENNDLNE